MKKRAQQPDAYTFTILLRGLSSYPTFSQSTARALHIYQLISADNSPVKPSIIHTNAVLKVCAMTHDIDALLRIAAELPTRGNGAPNKSTYTIILNAIRSNTLWPEDQRTSRRVSREEDAVGSEARALAVQQGRRLWVEIQQRWMSGDLLLDEELVCAFGRILLHGDEVQGHDDILSLLEQTMGVPRQIARQANSAIGKASDSKASGSNDDLELPPCSPESVDLENSPSSSKEDNESPASPSSSFAPLPNAAGPSQSAVRAGQNTLSLVLHACIRLKYDRAAQNYWGLLTSPDGFYQILPDSENYHMYLRLLRLRRSSKLAAELVDEMRSGDLTGKEGAVQTKTFIIALSCCVRDANNSNSITHARKLVKMMMESLQYPDAKALRMYLQVALGQKPRDWRVIVGAIRDTELGVKNLRSLLAYDPAGPKKQNEDNVLELVRGLISAFDVVLDLGNEEMASVEKKRCREQRHALAAYVTRMHNRLLAEGKIVRARKGEDKGRVRKFTSSDKSRNGRRSDEHYQADEKGEDVGFEGDKYEHVARRPAEDDGIVLPEKGEWNRDWKARGRQRKRETEDMESVDRAMAWKRNKMRDG